VPASCSRKPLFGEGLRPRRSPDRRSPPAPARYPPTPGQETFGPRQWLGQETGHNRRPPKPHGVLATVYQVLGVDQTLSFPDRSGRPISILTEGEPILEIL
jgi:hypothetical protein